MQKPLPKLATLLWIAQIAFIAKTIFFIRPRDPREFAVIDIYANAEIAIVGLTLLILVLNRRIITLFSNLRHTSVIMFIIYYLLSTVSVLWSPMPRFTLFRAIEYLVMFLAIFCALSFCKDFVNAERKILLVSLIGMLIEMCLPIKLYGFTFSIKAWHTNSYSVYAAMIFCYCFGEYFFADKKRAKLLLFYGAVALGVLILGTCITSFVAAVVGIFVVFALKHKIGIIPVIFCTAIAIYLFNPNVDWITSIMPIERDPESILTLSGRTFLWEQYKEMIAESPFYGGGFAIGSRLANFYAQSTHNFIYSILLGTGLTGMIIFIIYLIRFIYEVIETCSKRYIGSIGCAGALACGLINSLGLPIVADQWMAPSLVFGCISALFLLFIVLPHRHMAGQRRLEIMNSGFFYSNNKITESHRISN